MKLPLQTGVTILSIVLSGTIHAQLNNYDARGPVRITGSYHQLEIEPLPAELTTNKESAAGVVMKLLPPAIDLGASIITNVLKNGAKKYESSFTVTASASAFWIDEHRVNLPRLIITRMILRKGSGKPEPAFSLVLKPELSADSTAFRLVLAEPFDYHYSAAKTRGGYDYINIDLLIGLRSLSIQEGKYKLVDLRSTTLSIPMVKPGERFEPGARKLETGWFPFPPMPEFEVETEAASEVLKTVATKGTNNGRPDNDTLTTLTRTITSGASSIQPITERSGLYEFEIEVRETNPFKIRALVKQDVYKDVPALLGEVLKKAVSKEE